MNETIYGFLIGLNLAAAAINVMIHNSFGAIVAGVTIILMLLAMTD